MDALINLRCRSIADFEIVEQVGEGHLSAVLHCLHIQSGVHVAVKSYHKDRMNVISSRQVCFPGGFAQMMVFAVLCILQAILQLFVLEQHAAMCILRVECSHYHHKADIILYN